MCTRRHNGCAARAVQSTTPHRPLLRFVHTTRFSSRLERSAPRRTEHPHQSLGGGVQRRWATAGRRHRAAPFVRVVPPTVPRRAARACDGSGRGLWLWGSRLPVRAASFLAAQCRRSNTTTATSSTAPLLRWCPKHGDGPTVRSEWSKSRFATTDKSPGCFVSKATTAPLLRSASVSLPSAVTVRPPLQSRTRQSFERFLSVRSGLLLLSSPPFLA